MATYTRSDAITETAYISQQYSDITNNFLSHPVTDELIILKNEKSVNQAFKNLVLTNLGDRLFNPYLGSIVQKSLFENFSPFIQEDIVNAITNSVSQFEPRIYLISVTLDAQPDQNMYALNIVYALINSQQPINLTIYVSRVR